jgi:hypothetical protein
VDAAEVPDITVYNAYLPESGILKLQSGSGHISSYVQVKDDSASGNIRFDAPGAGVVVNGNELALDLTLEIDLANGSLKTRNFDLGGSYLKVSNLNYPDGRSLEDWSTAFTFEKGTLQWTRPVSLEADLSLSMTSSGPLVEVLAGNYSQIKWVRDALSVKDVSGSSRLRLDPQALVVQDLDISGENIEVRAKLQISNRGAKGVVFNRLGILRATVTFDGDERDWHILSARERFDSYPGF